MRAAAAISPLVVALDGAPIAPAMGRSITTIRVRERLSAPAMCEITFADPEQGAVPRASFSPGATLRVELREGRDPIFVGETTAVEHIYHDAQSRSIRIRAYDPLHRLGKRQPVKGHVEVSVAELFTELAADLGLTVSAPTAGPVWPRVMQYEQTDLELLSELAERSGLYFTARDGVIHLLTLEGVGDPLPLVLGESLLEARIELNSATVCRSVSTRAWDPLRGAPHHGSASSARSGRNVDATVDAARVGGSGERVLSDELAQADEQADALAQAELDARVGREVVLWGVADGEARVRAGSPVEVSGVVEQLTGRYVVTEVTHSVDERLGFISEFTTLPLPPRSRPRAAVVTTAVVTQVDDPEGLGRVKVALPTYSDLETGWMGVLTVAAGRGKGLVMLPDVDDHVLVLFPRGDPAQGVILGGLYGSTPPPDDAGIVSGKVQRMSVITPDGQFVRLDDALHSVRIGNHDGSYMELTPDAVVVHAAADLRLDASGHAIVVRGNTIDFEQA